MRTHFFFRKDLKAKDRPCLISLQFPNGNLINKSLFFRYYKCYMKLALFNVTFKPAYTVYVVAKYTAAV